MGCRALLLLPFLSFGAAMMIQLGPKSFGSEYFPTNPTSDPAVANNYSVLYFQQKVDHFGFYNSRTFKQRYLIADKHWKANGGTILFYTGNEGDIVWFCNNTGFMWDVAKELKAMLVFAEHRYYGESLPFGEESFKGEILDTCTTDHARLVVVTVVCLCESGKEKQVLSRALASSAPIWQFDDLVPCGVFMKIVTEDFRKSSPQCSESIRRSWKAINRHSTTGSDLQWLTKTFHLCSPLNFEDITTLKEWLSETWVNLAMVDYPYEASFLQPLPAWPVTVVCQYLKNPNVSDTVLLQNIFQALNIYYNYSGQAQCLNISQTATSSLGATGWGYQSCTELVMPICSNGVDDMFESYIWDFDKFSNDCFNQWGVKPRLNWIITLYGGKNISSHSNIIFSNGDLDPWSGGGVTKDITDTLVAINIPNGAHHLDLRASTAFDPSTVLLSRSLEVKHMKKWIADFYKNAKP
ncbi:lysosomal Pro-X carboxypeptidase-like protein [Cricetulus griseus]|uniref:Lysosomal Pro-X carboxypeptidase n=1 Tax=Cricetulus griseus TaxID=10029 RepID=A0A061ID77_CRIGR|nr:lysosomal Pro-X carboxypeptidase-like protein [Cricetulus griseus]